MVIRDIFDNIIDGDNVTKFKEEFCDDLKKVDNEEFLRIFYALRFANQSLDDCCYDCCDCDDCCCDDCDCDCDCDCE